MKIWDKLFGNTKTRLDATCEELLQQLKSGDPEKGKLAAVELGRSRNPLIIDALIIAFKNGNKEVRLNVQKAFAAFVIDCRHRLELVQTSGGARLKNSELAAMRKAEKCLQEISQHAERRSMENKKSDDTLTFRPQCPLCRATLDTVSRPCGIMTSGTAVCPACKQQVSLRVSPADNKLYVRMLTIPLSSDDPGEVVCDPLLDVKQEMKDAKQNELIEASSMPDKSEDQGTVLTTGISLSGTRYQVSTPISKAGRAGKCRDCAAIIKLVDAKEVCLDWDGVDAYHFYCPRCFKGTKDPHYYTGQLIGSDDKAVIDQHGWLYDR